MKKKSGKQKILNIQSGNLVVSHVKLQWELLKAFASAEDDYGFTIETLYPVIKPEEVRRVHHRERFLEYQILRPLQVALTCQGYDLYHLHCWTSNRLLKLIPRERQRLITVHDIAYLDTPEKYLPKTVRRAHRMMSWVQPQDHLVAVSQFTSDGLVSLCGFDPKMISVIPNGVDYQQLARQQPLPESLNHLSGQPYILVIGSNDQRKNLPLLPPVLEQVIKERPDVQLLRVGPQLPAEVDQALAQAGLNTNLHYADKLNAEDLAAVYHNAACLFFPSNFEGYGMPVPEALAAGVPVACSNIPPHLEVSGGHAAFFNPTDVETAAEKVLDCLNREEYIQKNIVEGQKFAEGLDWQICAKQYLDLYARLLNNA